MDIPWPDKKKKGRESDKQDARSSRKSAGCPEQRRVGGLRMMSAVLYRRILVVVCLATCTCFLLLIAFSVALRRL